MIILSCLLFFVSLDFSLLEFVYSYQSIRLLVSLSAKIRCVSFPELLPNNKNHLNCHSLFFNIVNHSIRSE